MSQPYRYKLPLPGKVLLVVGLLSLLSACGGSDDTNAPALTGAPEEPSPPEQPVEPIPPGPGNPDQPTGVLWSNPASWESGVPTDGDNVTIPAGVTMLLDTDTAALGDLRIEGSLEFLDEQDLTLTADSVRVTGGLHVGSPGQPFRHRALFVLTGSPEESDNTRGIIVMGGTLQLYGSPPSPVWTKLNENADAGATELTLQEPVDWADGVRIAVATTDFYGESESEDLLVAQAEGTRLVLIEGENLAAGRWGRMQYVTSEGMSLEPDPNFVPPATPAPTSIDERAAVGNLRRNIIVESIDDEHWQNDGYGAHIMVMGLFSTVEVDGIEIRRGGQSGILARYPFHWHLLSYENGAQRGDAVGHFLRNSAIWNSAQRCVVIHGTNGVEVSNNICYDIEGHAIFLEDAVERRNLIDGNLALKIREPRNIMKAHERTQGQFNGASGFWITNPDNTVINNHAGDTPGPAMWLSFPRTALGINRDVPYYPMFMRLGRVENNTVHSSRISGLLLENIAIDDPDDPINGEGTTSLNQYTPLTGEEACLNGDQIEFSGCWDRRARFEIRGITSFKNSLGGYRNRVSNPDYLEWAVADNFGMGFFGRAEDGVITRALIIGHSLNHDESRDYSRERTPAGLATYHSTVGMHHNTFVNLPFVDNVNSGAFGTDDYYLNSVEHGTVHNNDNLLINSSPGHVTLQPGLREDHRRNENHAISNGIWDPYGYWGPEGWYLSPDVPFMVGGGENCVALEDAGQNVVSCEDSVFGVGGFRTDFSYEDRFNFRYGIEVERYSIDDSSDLSSIGIIRIENGFEEYLNPDYTPGSGEPEFLPCTYVEPPEGSFCADMLGNMRHFGARQGSLYEITFPDDNAPLPRWVGLDIRNAWREDNEFIVGVEFDGTIPAQGYEVTRLLNNRATLISNPDRRQDSDVREFQPGTNLDAVINSDGSVFWQDTASDRVWFKHRGGLDYPGSSEWDPDTLDPDDENSWYRPYSVVIYPVACDGGSADECMNYLQSIE